MLTNLEVRVSVFDSTWVAGILALFIDVAVTRGHAVTTERLSAGGGVRLVSPKLVKTGVRDDLALTRDGQVGLCPGVVQFF